MAIGNSVQIIGRLGRDPEIRYSQGENATAFASFTIAAQRSFKNKEGKYDADWIRCTASGKTAEFIEKYFHKGDAIAVEGWIMTGSYTNKDGQTVHTTDVKVENVGFVPGAKKSDGATTQEDGFTNIPDGIDEELPF